MKLTHSKNGLEETVALYSSVAGPHSRNTLLLLYLFFPAAMHNAVPEPCLQSRLASQTILAPRSRAARHGSSQGLGQEKERKGRRVGVGSSKQSEAVRTQINSVFTYRLHISSRLLLL
jgi:hypothetical protein